MFIAFVVTERVLLLAIVEKKTKGKNKSVDVINRSVFLIRETKRFVIPS